jgi:hypothetical protein
MKKVIHSNDRRVIGWGEGLQFLWRPAIPIMTKETIHFLASLQSEHQTTKQKIKTTTKKKAKEIKTIKKNDKIG